MTRNKARKKAARRLARDTGQPYTAARREAAPGGWDQVLLPLDVDLGFVADVAHRQAEALEDRQLLGWAIDAEALAVAPNDPAVERPGHRRRRARFATMAEVYRLVLAERRAHPAADDTE